MIDSVQLGDIVKTRKTHACGGDSWEVIRTGADIKIKCQNCARIVMMPRDKYFLSVKKILERAAQSAEE